MINSSALSSQVAQTNNNVNLNKTDAKNDKLTNDKSGSKEALTEALKKNLGLSSKVSLPTKELSTNSEELNLKLKELVNKLLNQLGTKDSSKLITQGEKLNFAPNFSNELKFLANEMKKNEVFKDLFAKLEQILKPASQMKADNLAPLFKNSGVFFEAKLKDALNKEQLPSSFHSLLNTIKSLSSPKIANQIIALADKELDAKSSLNELKNIIHNQKNENQQIIKNSNFKTLLELTNKIENFRIYISKNPEQVNAKLENFVQNLDKFLNQTQDKLNKELNRFENLALKDNAILKDLRKSFDSLKENVKNILSNPTNQNKTTTKSDTPNTQNINNAGTLSQENVIKMLKQEFKNLSFSDKKTQMKELENLSKDLSILQRKANQSLKILDPQTSEAKNSLKDIRNLENKTRMAVKDIDKVVNKQATQIANEIKGDLKSTLLQVSNLAQKNDEQAVLNQANRLLTQIEINQLLSLADDSINTHLPYFWEDLNESKIIFKRGKKDKYFAQIKLNFTKLGELDIFIALNNDKYVDLNIMAENKEFRKNIYENAHELKRNMAKQGLLSSNFFVGDIVRSKLSTNANLRNYEFEMGVDKKA